MYFWKLLGTVSSGSAYASKIVLRCIFADDASRICWRRIARPRASWCLHGGSLSMPCSHAHGSQAAECTLRREVGHGATFSANNLSLQQRPGPYKPFLHDWK